MAKAAKKPSKYTPHQGEKEKARRVKQAEKKAAKPAAKPVKKAAVKKRAA